MLYHVRISEKSKSKSETKTNLTKEQLLNRFIEQYDNGKSIIINGKTILPESIERVRVSKSEQKIEHIIQQLKQKDRNSSVLHIGGPSYEWRAANEAEDVTDEFIKGPVGFLASEEHNEPIEKVTEKNKAFIVHGHDENMKQELEIFLHNLDIEPIVLHRQADGGTTLLEKIEKNSDVGYVFVLLTPDDIAYSAEEMDKEEDKRATELRARQNVIFEMGYFIGKLGRSRVCCLYKEGVEVPSDIQGLVYKKVKGSIDDIGFPIIKELQHVGLNPRLG